MRFARIATSAMLLVGVGVGLSACGGSKAHSSGQPAGAPPGLATTRVAELVGGVAPGFSAGRGPTSIATSLDGHLWFTEEAHRVARLNPDGTVNEFPTGDRFPLAIAAGREGGMWFTESQVITPDPRCQCPPLVGGIARITHDGNVTQFPQGYPGALREVPVGITSGLDGRVWFTENQLPRSAGVPPDPRIPPRVGYVKADGTVAEFDAGDLARRSAMAGYWDIGDSVGGITTAPDGRIWFTACHYDAGYFQSGSLNVLILDGSGTPVGLREVTLKGCPRGITADGNGRIWYTEPGTQDMIGTFFSSFKTAPSEFRPPLPPTGPILSSSSGIWYVGKDWSLGTEGLGRINARDVTTYLRAPATPGFNGSDVAGLTYGWDGKAWFTERSGAGAIARLDLGAQARKPGK